jgi:hypothetical protein
MLLDTPRRSFDLLAVLDSELDPVDVLAVNTTKANS